MKEKFPNEFKLIAVDAPIETRYTWGKERGRIGDEVSFEQFVKTEEEREKSSKFGKLNTDKVIEMADFILTNDGTKEDLYKKIDGIFLLLG